MDGDDQRVPVFFVSHARPDHVDQAQPPQDRYRHVKRFYDDLTANVNELIGSSSGQVAGFVDLAQAGGARWDRQVLRAAGTCQVMVCLLSTDYLFGSEWCPREWDVFTRRHVVRRATGEPDREETAILLVRWARVLRPLPKAVAEINRFTPLGLPQADVAAYEDNGILGLIRTRNDDVYDAVVWKLAMHIQQLHHNYLVEPAVPDGIEGLRTTFAEEDG
ncbi:TIR-like protein FxsC [Dactylosporangium sp. CA-139114]|uniref:TIR-like protein FxsC n=1 Tax=Dactylosporangium sp. CA-139114 TaxID=3239931 RepID=UPI003D96D7B6